MRTDHLELSHVSFFTVGDDSNILVIMVKYGDEDVAIIIIFHYPIFSILG